MRKNIRVTEPSAEMKMKIQMARHAISNQKMRMVKCPYCGHNSIAVFEDTRGHVQAKCKQCGRETVFNVLSMRRLRLNLHGRLR
jgi:transcription elongation factor Elf1